MQKVRFWQNPGNIILTAKIDGALIPFSQTLLEFRIKTQYGHRCVIYKLIIVNDLIHKDDYIHKSEALKLDGKKKEC